MRLNLSHQIRLARLMTGIAGQSVAAAETRVAAASGLPAEIADAKNALTIAGDRLAQADGDLGLAEAREAELRGLLDELRSRDASLADRDAQIATAEAAGARHERGIADLKARIGEMQAGADHATRARLWAEEQRHAEQVAALTAMLAELSRDLAATAGILAHQLEDDAKILTGLEDVGRLGRAASPR